MFDSKLRNCLSRIMCCSISDNAWHQATLSFHLGGLGLCESDCSSHPAFLGLCNSVCILMSQLAPNFDATSSFPGKDCAISYFQILSSNLSSQNDKQVSLDNQLFTTFQTPPLSATKLVYVLLLTALWLAESHSLTMSGLGLVSTQFCYCCLFMVECSFPFVTSVYMPFGHRSVWRSSSSWLLSWPTAYPMP